METEYEIKRDQLLTDLEYVSADYQQRIEELDAQIETMVNASDAVKEREETVSELQNLRQRWVRQFIKNSSLKHSNQVYNALLAITLAYREHAVDEHGCPIVVIEPETSFIYIKCQSLCKWIEDGNKLPLWTYAGHSKVLTNILQTEYNAVSLQHTEYRRVLRVCSPESADLEAAITSTLIPQHLGLLDLGGKPLAKPVTDNHNHFI